MIQRVLLTTKHLGSKSIHVHRFLSTELTYSKAKQVLGLCVNSSVPDAKILRNAYLQAAKKTHPDLRTNSRQDFQLVSDAYELLLSGAPDSRNADFGITINEEQDYRQACRNWLGIDAEIVEEAKRDPAFRNWVKLEGSSTRHWRQFLSLHGGLAPMLKPKKFLENNASTKDLKRRRRRRN